MPTSLPSCLADGAGQWVPSPSPTLSPLYDRGPAASKTGGLPFPQWSKHDSRLCAPHPSSVAHTWKPACTHPLLDIPHRDLPAHFCRRLAGTRILIVGDSIQMQWFYALASWLNVALRRRGPTNHTHSAATTASGIPWSPSTSGSGLAPGATYDTFESCGAVSPVGDTSNATSVVSFDIAGRVHVCPEGSVSLHYLRNLHAAVNHSTDTAHVVGSNSRSCIADPADRHQPWLAAATQSDVVVLGAGAHYVQDHLLAANVDRTLAALARLPNKPRVLWRGTAAAIPHCRGLPDPLESPVTFEGGKCVHARHPFAAIKRMRKACDEAHGYHWHRFQAQSQLVRRLVEAAGHAYIDTYVQTALRPGGRWFNIYNYQNDCLHWCFPGPADEWSRLLMVWLLNAHGPATREKRR